MKMTRMNGVFPTEYKRDMKIIAAMKGVRLNDVHKIAIEQYLKRNQKLLHPDAQK